MSWLKIETCTPDKPEVWAIADALGIDADAAFGKVFRVWAWFDQHTESGNAQVTRRALLDRIAGVTGFADAMIAAGWLLDNDGVLTLPNFERHNGQTAKARALTAKRVAEHKAKTNDEVTRAALPERYLEKRREEKEKNTEYTPIVPLAGDEPKAKAKRRGDPVAYSDDFERFWEIYPPRRKQKKRTAWEAWLKAIRREAPLTIIEAVEEYADSLEGRGEYCKMPATWLNGDCWDDDRLAWDGKSRRSRVATAEELANWTPYGN